MATNTHDVDISKKKSKTNIIRQLIIGVTAVIVAWITYQSTRKPERADEDTKIKQVNNGNNSKNYQAGHDMTVHDETITKNYVSNSTKRSTIEGFSLSPYNVALASALRKAFNIKISENKSGNLSDLEIKTTGESKEVSDGLYMFQGGHVVLKVNGYDCYEFSNFLIDKTPFQGNTKNEIDSYINHNISKFIVDNTPAIVKAVQDCIYR